MTEYLWDRSGEPDEEIERLEALLAPYAHRGSLPALPRRHRTHRVMRVLFPLLTAAASVALVIAAARVAASIGAAGWAVSATSGAPVVAGRAVALAARLPVGESLATDASSTARLDVGEIGEVDVAPNSRLRLLRARAGEHRMALEQGQIAARIWAPPRSFFVNTPSATTIDLGCAYTLTVDANGQGLVRVQSGWVAFEEDGRESFIPKGAVCLTRPGFGPGTPHYDDAAPALVAGLSILDFSPTQDVNRRAALDAVLSASRARDGLTLWHLLTRGSVDERARVCDRMADLVPIPAGFSKENVLNGDRAALDAWWDARGLDSASWWRIWKSPWRATGRP